MRYNRFFNSATDAKLNCSCGCGGTITDERLIWILTAVREHFGKPVIITSGFRCEAYNRKVGGAKSSQHLKGLAVDFQVKGIKPSVVREYLEGLVGDRFGIGRADTFTHLDLRPGPGVRFSY